MATFKDKNGHPLIEKRFYLDELGNVRYIQSITESDLIMETPSETISLSSFLKKYNEQRKDYISRLTPIVQPLNYAHQINLNLNFIKSKLSQLEKSASENQPIQTSKFSSQDEVSQEVIEQSRYIEERRANLPPSAKRQTWI